VTQREFGRYELLTTLARGGMAELLLGRLVGVGGFAKVVAIKRMLPHLSEDPHFVEMFLNEGRIAARLSHPNICQVYELGEVEGQLYLAMEYLDGLAWEELNPLLSRGHGFELRIAAGVLGQACDGLHYAHSLADVDGTPTPVVHRDVSPQNLFVTTEGVCKVLDFGVSKVLTEGSRTRTGMIKGKLPYMAPEQIRGEAVDARSDVFSAGVVLWESLTGERLFVRDSDYQIWRAVTEDDIPLVTAKTRGLPGAIDTVVTRALERDPERRYPTIRHLAQDLRHVAGELGGALDPAEISEAIRSLAAAQLAERTRKVGAAIGKQSGRSSRPPVSARRLAPYRAVSDPGSTQHDLGDLHAGDLGSMVLRDESIAIGRPPARRAWPWVVAFLAIAGGVTVWAVTSPPSAAPHRLATGASIDAALVAASDPSPGRDAAGVGIAAAEVDAGAVPTPVGDSRREHHRDRRTKDKAAPTRTVEPPGTGPGSGSAPVEPAAKGTYSVDSTPYATIYVDGRSRGDTPLFRIPLTPGKHTVKAVRADGTSQSFAITIESGKPLSSGKLRW